MQSIPLTIGAIHLVGIGGIGMSGIAELLHNLGYTVQGSDISESANVTRLRDLGMTVHVGHDADNLGDAGAVVISSAVKDSNPEVKAARSRRIPVVRRAEMLAELMRLKWSIAVAGTHGKTTTTSLIATLLDGGDMDPTVINGGIINAYGTNARLGTGEWMVVEADESDGTFIRIPATIALVSNIDPEHMEFYGDFDKLREAFRTFINQIPFYGFAALCIDHPEVQALLARIPERRLVTYGFSPQADVRATNLRFSPQGVTFDLTLGGTTRATTEIVTDIALPMYGRHNVQNACGAIAVALELGVSPDAIRSALAKFGGVKRRFTRTGTWNGAVIIDDYGHHPVEIAAVLGAAREAATGKVIAVIQPHRYSRLQGLFEDFCSCANDAEHVLVTDVYPAGEEPINGISAGTLVNGMSARGHKGAELINAPAELATRIAQIAQDGDMVICLGAGSISAWAHALPGQLAQLKPGDAS